MRLICLFVLALAVSVAVLMLAGGAGVRTLGLLTADCWWSGDYRVGHPTR
ncbi:hypothetical protein CZ674_00665 [Agrococcus casei LMG 22410]|uniref:Uncharacterized protein n=1 Tax=Agrococcus casei LMG 22410 TaxID=1255656 RepID=A0A1R4ESU1_9MICO|nr:hypothetical protein CZ674_00665 [Agrococcus casei LMG 22410]